MEGALEAEIRERKQRGGGSFALIFREQSSDSPPLPRQTNSRKNRAGLVRARLVTKSLRLRSRHWNWLSPKIQSDLSIPHKRWRTLPSFPPSRCHFQDCVFQRSHSGNHFTTFFSSVEGHCQDCCHSLNNTAYLNDMMWNLFCICTTTHWGVGFKWDPPS